MLPWALPVHGATTTDWALLVFLGVVQIGLAYVLLTSALRQVPAFEASLLLLFEPMLNPIWAWWVQGERPSHWALVGCAIIFVATLVKTVSDARAAGLLAAPDA